MSPDQVMCLLTDRDILRGRSKTMPLKEAHNIRQKDGSFAVRMADGSLRKGVIGGKSVCAMLTEKLRAKEAAEKVGKKEQNPQARRRRK